MSLVAFAIRIATVRALRAALWPSFRVEDSPQAPLDLIDGGQPLVAVYTGVDADRFSGRDLLGGSPKTTLSIQIFLPAEVSLPFGQATLSIDTRARGADTLLDVVSRRIRRALLEPNSGWAELWRSFVQMTGVVSDNSYLVETTKVRVSARELSLVCDTIHEPDAGAPPTDCWAALIAAMRTDTGPDSVAPLADWIANEIQGAVLPAWQVDQIALGLSDYGAAAIGLAPLVTESGLPIELSTAVLADDSPEAPLDPETIP